MTDHEIRSHLAQAFPASLRFETDHLLCTPDALLSLGATLRNELAFVSLACVSGVDLPAEKKFVVVYHFYRYEPVSTLCLKVELDRNGTRPALASLSSLYKSADWLEREVFDMLGIHFDGHPDLRRILCPEDWEGYPLRKDYTTPDFYQGMPVPLVFPPQPEGDA